MPADLQMSYSVSHAHAQWFFLPEDQSRSLWHHFMMSQWSLMLFWEGTIKGEHTQSSGLLSGFSDTEWLGLLTSHRPSTLAILVPLVEQSITRMKCVFHLSIRMYPDLLGNILVSMTLVVWCYPGRSLPASPWTWYWAKHGSQPFGSGLQGWDKLLVWCESLPIYLVYLCTTCHISDIPGCAQHFSTLST